MVWQLQQLIKDIDYMAQQLLNEKGVMPDAFYGQSMSNWISAQRAESPQDRVGNPLDIARQLGAL
ncbi:hypothetical protein EFS61_09510 [Lactobacillus hominis]|nr:hypothetical protein [Lactobacillus hominis]